MSRTDIPPSERKLAPREAAHALGIDGDTLSKWARAGDIEFIRDPGGHRRYPQREVDRILGAMNAVAAASARVPAGALHPGDFCLLPLADGDTFAGILRVLKPGAAGNMVLLDYRTTDHVTGTHPMICTDEVILVRAGRQVAA